MELTPKNMPAIRIGSLARITDPFEYWGEVVTVVAPYDYPGVQSTTVELRGGHRVTVLDKFLSPLPTVRA